jgi:hypothetical protein
MLLSFVLGTFRIQSRKATISFVISVCLSHSPSLSPSCCRRVSDGLPVDGLFSGKLLLYTYTDMCREIEHSFKIILSNNQHDAALSSRVYSSLQGYSTCFGCFPHPSSGVQLKLQMQS